MKNPRLSLSLLAVVSLFTAGFASGQARPSSGSVEQQNTTNGSSSDPQVLKDKAFLRQAADGGMAEIQLAQLASQKTQNPDVKSFADKLVTDHTTINDSLKPIADSYGIKPPTKLAKKDQAEYNKLSAVSGPDFDKEYEAYLLKAHRQDLKDFTNESGNTTNSQLASATADDAKIIQQHLTMLEQMTGSSAAGK